MAYLSVHVAEGLPLHSIGGFSERPKPHDIRPDDDHVAGRSVARCLLEFRALGSCSRVIAHRSPIRERGVVHQTVLWFSGARRDSDFMGGDPILRVLHMVDFPSRRHGSSHSLHEDIRWMGRAL